MFNRLHRKTERDQAGRLVCRLTICDTCFTVDIIQSECICNYYNCATTTCHLVKLYEAKKLNVPLNVARYYKWLAINGYGNKNDPRDHKDYMVISYPNLKFEKLYYKQILTYQSHRKLMK